MGAAIGVPAGPAVSSFAMTTLSIECPDGLAEQLRRLVSEGWVVDEQQALVEALRRFLDSHRPELIESQVRSDVQWGLHGKD